MRTSTVVLLLLVGWPCLALAQSISFQEFSPFVMGLIPVVRNGAVGGVSIDAAGVVRRSTEDDEGALHAAWLNALPGAPDDVNRISPLRKISLRRLERALSQAARQQQPLPAEMQFLAGMLRVKFVLVYPDQSDIVLAGPAEGWQVDAAGNIVGRRSGTPVLQLEDLLVALAAADENAGDSIRCSIDPSPDGLRDVQRLIKSGGLRPDAQGLPELEETLGPQTVTLAGVPPSSRFARLMLAADYRMKRLAMGFEPPPIDGLPPFLELFAAGAAPRTITPRWWLAAKYEPLLRSPDGLAWELRGPGVQCLTEEHRLLPSGETAHTGKSGPAAARWAENMTRTYTDLSREAPIFSELRNLMDLAVVAALLAEEDLYSRSGWSLPTLRDPQAFLLTEFAVPATVPSQANLIRQRGATVVTVSGGVEIDPWSVVQKTEPRPALSAAHKRSAPPATQPWWWD